MKSGVDIITHSHKLQSYLPFNSFPALKNLENPKFDIKSKMWDTNNHRNIGSNANPNVEFMMITMKFVMIKILALLTQMNLLVLLLIMEIL